MSRYQIRDGDFGLSIEDAESPRDALYAFFAARTVGELRSLVKVAADGSATVTVRGETFTAVPVEKAPS